MSRLRNFLILNHKIKNIYIPLLFLFISNCFSFNTFKVFDIAPKSIELNELLISGNDKEKILIISVDGVISEKTSGDTFGLSSKESMIARIREELSKAYTDSDIKGIILKINSPGGGVTASDIIYNELSNFKRLKKIPIVSLFMDTAASGGYYISMASDKIIAHPTTITGSIGVIITGVNVKKGLEKLGIEDQTIVSGGNKNILSPLSDFSKEQRAIIQAIVNDMYERFFQIVIKNRNQIPESKLKELADGRIFTASQAKKEGLIDEIGYFEDAIRMTIQLINNSNNTPGRFINPRIITYSPYKKTIKNYYQISDENYMEKNYIQNLIQNIQNQSEFKFMYMWIY